MAISRTATPPSPPKLTAAKPSAPPAKAPKPGGDSAEQAISPRVTELPKPHDRTLGHGTEHGMKPIEFPHADEIHSFSDLAKAMGGTTAGGRDVGQALEVLQAMKADKKCFTVLTLSGNATPLSPLIGNLLDAGLIHCIVSTGSICTHSFSVERGRPLFQVSDPEAVDDNWFYAKGYNRIYDCVELEESLNEGFDILRELVDTIDPDTTVCSADITELVGNHLNTKFKKEDGLLHAAERNGVPIFIPAFSDCELGLDFYAINKLREKEGKTPLRFDAFEDWQRYADLIKEHKDSCGVITLGGGTPRNWAQQVGPSFDILTEYKVEPESLIMRFKYAVRICSAPGTEAGLSGCSYCLHGDTLVETPRNLKLYPHGIPIRELVGKAGFPVYSYDREKKRIVLSNVASVFPSGRKKLYKVNYSWTAKGNASKRSKRCTGEVIASADHQFLMRDGTYKKLSELKSADRLMPFNVAYKQNGYAVESVEYWGEDETFDMTVDDTHNFAANSVILKNSEGRSWGKFWPPETEGGNKNEIIGMNAEICGDYTLAFPLLAACMLEDTTEQLDGN